MLMARQNIPNFVFIVVLLAGLSMLICSVPAFQGPDIPVS